MDYISAFSIGVAYHIVVDMSLPKHPAISIRSTIQVKSIMSRGIIARVDKRMAGILVKLMSFLVSHFLKILHFSFSSSLPFPSTFPLLATKYSNSIYISRLLLNLQLVGPIKF